MFERCPVTFFCLRNWCFSQIRITNRLTFDWLVVSVHKTKQKKVKRKFSMSILNKLRSKFGGSMSSKKDVGPSSPMGADPTLNGNVDQGPDSLYIDHVSEEDQKSILRITIVDGKDLPIADIFSSDPYVICKINGGQVYKSQTIMSNLNPTWNETFEIPVHEKHDLLEFEVWDYDTLSSDDFMGKCALEISNLVRHVEVQHVLSIGAQGYLKLRLCPLNFGRYLETVIRGPVGKQDVPDESKVQDPIAVWQASPIKKIIVYCAQTITALRIIYANDTTGVTIGNADNGLEREIVMEEGEFIVSVSGRATANSHVDAIQFGTNLGRKTGWLGGFGGIVFTCENNNKMLRSISGFSSGKQIDQLSFVFEN